MFVVAQRAAGGGWSSPNFHEFFKNEKEEEEEMKQRTKRKKEKMLPTVLEADVQGGASDPRPVHQPTSFQVPEHLSSADVVR